MAHCLFLLIKLYWNTTTPIHLCIVHGFSHATISELSSHDRDCMAPEAENITIWTFTEKVCQLLFHFNRLPCPLVSDGFGQQGILAGEQRERGEWFQGIFLQGSLLAWAWLPWAGESLDRRSKPLWGQSSPWNSPFGFQTAPAFFPSDLRGVPTPLLFLRYCTIVPHTFVNSLSSNVLMWMCQLRSAGSKTDLEGLFGEVTFEWRADG